MSTIRTQKQLEELANDWANETIKINEISADQATETNDLKKRYKAKLDDLKKEVSNMKKRIGNWLTKNSIKVYGQDGVGTIKTEQVEIQLSNNPPAIKQLDTSISEQELIEQIKEKGYRSVIVTKEIISKELLEKLPEETLELLGFYKARSQTVRLTPLAEPKAKANSKISN